MNLTDPEKALVVQLLRLAESERGTLLDRVCADTPAFASRRAALLDALSGADPGPGAQAVPPSGADAARLLGLALESRNEDASGTRIGSYRLLQKIGEGGFGTVWMAEQHEPIRRRVAIKIIKLGMDTEEVIARFEAERQALALMDHPNIARVFDAGATEAGRPYFVMELVRGVAITRYCDENRLSAAARLRLIIAVCQGVQHAHQKGIIHRDLKPSNILVTLHDGVPVPKIIDFGIAKATGPRLTEKTLFTQFHSFIGTPAYTSPEQVEMSGLDIDTRSDIYSLGVLLYELLTGRPPFESDDLLKSGVDAMRRTIREIDPPRPSHRLGTLSEANRGSIARERATDPVKLSLLLRGDLDWIAMRCLEKDRTRRYESAASLAADLERHLRDDPVEARPPSRIYQARKFIRRHKLWVAASTAVAASLLVGLVASWTLLVRERSAHTRATVAEKKETELRRQAEAARADEVHRLARTALELADRSLADGHVADGLAYLATAARNDPFNPVLAPRIASVLASHNFLLPESPPFECGSRIVSLQFSVDGRRFFVGAEDGTMRIFDAIDGHLVREYQVGKAVQPTGGWLFPQVDDTIVAARFPDGTVALLEAATGRPRARTIQLDPVTVQARHDAIELSPDGRWLCAFGSHSVWVWDTQTSELMLGHTFEGDGVVKDFAFRPDGRQMAVVAGNAVYLWSLPGFARLLGPIEVERPRGGFNNPFLYARFFPDNRRLAILDGLGSIHIHDANTGRPLVAVLDSADGATRSAWLFAPDGRLLRAGSTTAELRDLENGKIVPFPTPDRGGYWNGAFSRDGSRLLTAASADGLARLTDTSTGKVAAEFTVPKQPGIRGVLSPDGTRVVIGDAKGSLLRLQVGKGAARPLIVQRAWPAMPLMFMPTPPARLLWFTADRARVLDVASGREIAGGFLLPRRITEPAPGEGSAHSPLRADHKFLIVRQGAGWEAWELAASGVVKVVPLRDNTPPAGTIFFSPLGDTFAIAYGTAVRVWDLHTGAAVGPSIDPQRPLYLPNISFSPDGRLLGTSYTGAPGVWDVTAARPATGTFVPAIDLPLADVEFSPDGTRILTGDLRGEARLWDSRGKPVSPVLFHGDGLTAVAFAPDGHYFITRSFAEVRIWETNGATPIGRPIPLYSGRTLSFSRDSRRFVVSSEDGMARIVDVRTAQLFTEPLDHGPVRLPTAFFSPDARFIRTESIANDFRIWAVPSALPDGEPAPEWLLQLAIICAGRFVNKAGELTEVPDVAAGISSLRGQLASMPSSAPLVEWGRWILDDRPDRPIAPGFTITPAEADELFMSSGRPLP